MTWGVPKTDLHPSRPHRRSARLPQDPADLRAVRRADAAPDVDRAPRQDRWRCWGPTRNPSNPENRSFIDVCRKLFCRPIPVNRLIFQHSSLAAELNRIE